MKKLKYFLDHPQIKRSKAPGNGNSPRIGEQSSSLQDKVGTPVPKGPKPPERAPKPKPQPKPKKAHPLASRLGEQSSSLKDKTGTPKSKSGPLSKISEYMSSKKK